MSREKEINIHIETSPMDAIHYDALMVGVFEDTKISKELLNIINRYSHIKVEELIELGEIRGIYKEFTLLHLPPNSPFKRIIFMGMGKEKELNIDIIRSISAKAVRTLRKIRCSEMVVMPKFFPQFPIDKIAEAVTEGVILGDYRLPKYQYKIDNPKPMFNDLVFLVSEKNAFLVKEGSFEGKILGIRTNNARDLGNEPSNFLTPISLTERAKKYGEEIGLEVEIFNKDKIEKLGMGGIQAVSSGSKYPPFLVILRYKGGDEFAPTLGFVGKGITFDSGGLCLKNATAMHRMKFDMSGAAAVLQATCGIADLKIPINIITVIPVCENMLDANGYKPGDIIKMYNGKYVEIKDTDAEGRMILADALSYICEQGVDLVIDLATLTGGVKIALGHITSAILGNNEWLIKKLIESGKITEEKLWELPIFPEYKIHLSSSVADIANTGDSKASTIQGGIFFKEFINKPWAHIDICGTAWTDEDSSLYYHKPYTPKRGATGVGVRTLIQFAKMVSKITEGKKEKLQNLLDQ